MCVYLFKVQLTNEKTFFCLAATVQEGTHLTFLDICHAADTRLNCTRSSWSLYGLSAKFGVLTFFEPVQQFGPMLNNLTRAPQCLVFNSQSSARNRCCLLSPVKHINCHVYRVHLYYTFIYTVKPWNGCVNH